MTAESFLPNVKENRVFQKNRKDFEKKMKIHRGRVVTQQAQSNCINLRIANVSWDKLDTGDSSEVPLSKSERRKLAKLGKPLADAGVYYLK